MFPGDSETKTFYLEIGQKELTYIITLSLDTSIGNEFANKHLIAHLYWWLDDEDLTGDDGDIKVHFYIDLEDGDDFMVEGEKETIESLEDAMNCRIYILEKDKVLYDNLLSNMPSSLELNVEDVVMVKSWLDKTDDLINLPLLICVAVIALCGIIIAFILKRKKGGK